MNMCSPAEAGVQTQTGGGRTSNAGSGFQPLNQQSAQAQPAMSPKTTASAEGAAAGEEPSVLARYTCASILVGIFAVWGKLSFIDEDDVPRPIGGDQQMHSLQFPVAMTAFYLISLPLLRELTNRFLAKRFDMKLLLRESMVLYNAGQVVVNGWMVYRFICVLLFRDHPFIGGDRYLVNTGATYAIWVHYCDKYLEFLDTYFMVLRGKMDQVSFLHVYHHTSIALAWWVGLTYVPGGDCYFGALLNSWIHVMMYSYYALSLLKIPCPWKKYLTQAQLLQFTIVVLYSLWSMSLLPKDTEFTMYLVYSTQLFEMTSLFVLFMHFYRKAYSDKKKKKQQQKELAAAAELAKRKLSPSKVDESEMNGAVASSSTVSGPESDSNSEVVAEQASVSSESSSDEEKEEQS